MRKCLILLLVSVVVVSCFKSTYSESRNVCANFEYGQNSSFASDSTYFSAEGVGFGWDYLIFCYGVNPETKNFGGGFKLSRQNGLLDKEVEGLDLTWRSYTDVVGNTYLVYLEGDSMQDSDVEFLSKTYGTCTAQSCFVANTAAVAKEIKAKFQRGDKLTLVAKGFLKELETGRVEMNLADFTQNDKDGHPKDSIVSRWTMFDLAPLGEFDKIKFSVESTKSVTCSFCLDELRANVSIEY